MDDGETPMADWQAGCWIRMALTTVRSSRRAARFAAVQSLRLSCFVAELWTPKALDCCGHRSSPGGASGVRKPIPAASARHWSALGEIRP